MTREEARKRLRGILTEAVEFENSVCYVTEEDREPLEMAIQALDQDPGRCKNCKYFEYDHVGKVYGIPLIVAHEICSRWGDGCKTRDDGYCFLFEKQESEE